MALIDNRFKKSTNTALISSLLTYLNHAKEEDLFHINVFGLADQWNAARKELLDLFVEGIKVGIFVVQWEYHCPGCGKVAHETLTIHEARSVDFCDNCRADFKNKLDENIEVFFSIHPGIRQLSPKYQEYYIKEMEKDLIQNKKFTWKKDTVIKGVDLIQNHIFREVMGDEVLLPDQSLEIMKVAILFTDIQGSTQKYTNLGDYKAFQGVREHFRILFDVIIENNGVPVKTIGDAVMGTFVSEQDSIKASLEIQRKLIEYHKDKVNDEKIEVKIGVHVGTALVVTLNGRLDYFGTTVNMAARIQSVAGPNEVVVSEEIFKLLKPDNFIASFPRFPIKKQKLKFKGLAGKHKVFYIRVS